MNMQTVLTVLEMLLVILIIINALIWFFKFVSYETSIDNFTYDLNFLGTVEILSHIIMMCMVNSHEVTRMFARNSKLF